MVAVIVYDKYLYGHPVAYDGLQLLQVHLYAAVPGGTDNVMLIVGRIYLSLSCPVSVSLCPLQLSQGIGLVRHKALAVADISLYLVIPI